MKASLVQALGDKALVVRKAASDALAYLYRDDVDAVLPLLRKPASLAAFYGLVHSASGEPRTR